MVISSNILAMNAQRQFGINTEKKRKTTEKLSSGYKINRAADDAAGLTISEKLRRQIRGLDQGARNTQDGISLLQVADGALNEVHDMLHRINELSIKSANGTNTSEDRVAIQQEVDQIVSEIDRIGNDTEFNTRKLFKHDNVKTDETGKKYKIEYEYVTTTYTETVADTYTYTETSPAHYGVSSISAKGQLTDTINNTFLLTADETGLHVNSDLYKWDEIYSTGGDALSSLGQYQSYNIEYNGSTITINTADCTDIKSLINSIDGVKIDYTESTRSVTSPIVSISADSFIRSNPKSSFVIDGNDDVTLSISATDDAILLKSGYKTVSAIPWSRVSFTEGANTVEAKVQSNIPITFTLNKTDNYREDFKGILQSSSPSIVYHGDYTYSAVSDYSITVNGNTTYTMEVHNLETALADVGFTSGTVTENKKATGTIYSHGVHDVYFDLYANNKKMRFYLDDTGDVRLDRDTRAGDYFFYRFYYQKQDGTTSNAYVEIPILYGENMTASETRRDLYNRNVSIYFGSKYTAKSIDIGASSAVVRTKKYSVEGLNDAPDETMTHEVITGYHDEERTKVDVIEKKIYIEDGDDNNNNGTREIWIQSGAEPDDGMFITIGAMNKDVIGLADIDVSTADGARVTIDKVKTATNKISEMRSSIGAQQNRLEHTYRNITNIAENTQAAESRIRDADMAKEMVELSKQNILEQVGTSMITQANQSKQGVLNLLQ